MRYTKYGDVRRRPDKSGKPEEIEIWLKPPGLIFTQNTEYRHEFGIYDEQTQRGTQTQRASLKQVLTSAKRIQYYERVRGAVQVELVLAGSLSS